MKRRKILNISSTKGSSIVIFAVAFTLIVAIAALAVDIGMLALEKTRLSSAADSAALAGVQELIRQPDNVSNVVNSYIQKNKGALEALNTTENTVEVKVYNTVDSYFSKIFGYDTFRISASATAKAENISSLTGVRPLGIVHQNFVFGQLYTLKEDAGDGISGNYGAVALDVRGADTYQNNLLYGYGGTVSEGETIETETGNMAGPTEYAINQLINQCNHTPPCTYESYNQNCSRVIYLPVVNTFDLNGRKYVTVLGFATFFLEGVSVNDNKAEIIGRFITSDANGETSEGINNYGTYGLRLIK